MDEILSTLGEIGSIGTAIGTLALVVLFWKTIMQLEETVKVSKIQSNYRFRPWIGHLNRIEFTGTKDDKDQFSMTVKNYGELPSSDVTVRYMSDTKQLKRDELKSDKISSFNLGPLLPNMEKKYWFYIDSKSIKDSKSGDAQIFVLLYFEYRHHSGTSGYGLISKYDRMTENFVHYDMWLDENQTDNA